MTIICIIICDIILYSLPKSKIKKIKLKFKNKINKKWKKIKEKKIK